MAHTAAMPCPFHLALHVADLEQTRAFYGDVLGCPEGRRAQTWVDFDFFGHQLSFHLGTPWSTRDTGRVGDHRVPMPHLGVVLDEPTWQAVADRLTAAGVDFVLPPTTRFVGEPGEQRTMFLRDPSGNAIEIKSFKRTEDVFAS